MASTPGSPPVLPRARALAWFRAVVGAALGLHFAGLAVAATPLLAWTGLYDPRLLGEMDPSPPWLGSGLSPAELRGVFCLGALLALGVAAGRAPRLCAASLWLLSIAVYRAILPIADLSDYLAGTTSLFLALAPAPGRSRGARSPARPDDAPLPALAATMFAAQVVLLHLGGELGELALAARGGAILEGVARLLPAALVLPVPALRLAGAGLLAGLHAYGLATGRSPLGQIVLGASGLLFLGEGAAPGRPRVLDAGGAAAAVCMAVALVALAGPRVGLRGASAPFARMASDAGLLPASFPPPGEAPGALAIVVKEPARRDLLPGDGALFRRLVARLSEADEVRPIRSSLAASLARRYCIEHGYWGLEGTLVRSDGPEEQAVLEFECGSGGSLALLR